MGTGRRGGLHRQEAASRVSSGDRLYALWLLVATTGMRRAELAGLRWSDIDFARARLTPRLPGWS